MGGNTTNTYIDPRPMEWLVKGKHIRTPLQHTRAASMPRRAGQQLGRVERQPISEF